MLHMCKYRSLRIMARNFAIADLVLVCLIAVTASLPSSLQSATEPDEDQAKFERLMNITRARELFVLGENCYKNGFLEEAVRYWMQTLDLKPDSEHTRRCLQKARAELVSDYAKRSKRYEERGDVLSAYILLDAIAHLVPEEQSYTEVVKNVEDKLTSDQRLAKDAYNEARSHFAVRNYPKAKEAIERALAYGRSSSLISGAARTITDAYNAHRYTVERLPADLFTTREVAFENYFWHHEKTITKSVPTPDRGSINKTIACYSLRGRLRNITLAPISKVTIRARVLDARTGAVVGDVEGDLENLKPGVSTEMVFTRFTGRTLKVLTTASLTAASLTDTRDQLTVTTRISKTTTIPGSAAVIGARSAAVVTTRISKTTTIPECEAVCGYASVDDKENIGSIYKIEAYDITTETAGTGARVEQPKSDFRIRQNY